MKWFTSYFSGSDAAGKKRAPHERGQEHDGSGKGFKNSVYFWRKGGRQMNWPDPRYFSKMRQDMDLYYVLNQLCAIIQVNAPLPKGIDALLQEERRSRDRMGMDRSLRSWLTAVAAALVLGVMFILNVLMVISSLIGIIVCLAYQNRITRSAYLSALIVLLLILMALTAYAFVYVENMRLSEDYPGAAFYVMVYLLGALVAIIGGYCFLVCSRLAVFNPPREAVLVRLRNDLEAGMDLSQAMRGMPRFFPQRCTAIVQAGEGTGQLQDGIETLLSDYRADRVMKDQLRSSMIYLLALVLIHIAVFGFLMFRVAPVFKEIHESFDAQVHAPLTDSIMAVIHAFSRFLNEILSMLTRNVAQAALPSNAWPYGAVLGLLLLIPLTLIAGLLVAAYTRKGPDLRRGAAGLSLRVPLLGDLIVNHNLEFIAYIMSRLLSVGATLDSALAQAAAGELSTVYVHMLRRVQKRIVAGESLTEAFQLESTAVSLPPAFTGMTAIGEHAGMLPQAFDFLAAYYRSRKEARQRMLYQLVQPAGIVLLGLVSMGFILEIYMALVGIIDAVLMEMY